MGKRLSPPPLNMLPSWKLRNWFVVANLITDLIKVVDSSCQGKMGFRKSRGKQMKISHFCTFFNYFIIYDIVVSISIQDIGRGKFYKGKCGFSVVHGKKKKSRWFCYYIFAWLTYLELFIQLCLIFCCYERILIKTLLKSQSHDFKTSVLILRKDVTPSLPP